MKVAVTGATGFVGRHVVQRLAKEDVTIIASGRDREKWNGIGEFVELDISSLEENPYQVLGSPDVLIHLAWSGLPNYQSLHHFEKELPEQYTFLKSMIAGGLKSLTIAGTCFEYGMKSGCLTEDITAEPQNPYGFAKNTLRQMLTYLATNRGIELNWLRLFYIWGEDQASNSLYPLLLKAISRQEESFNMSGGEQLRDYLHISDVADYLVRIALQPTGCGVVNISSGTPISVRRLVEKWKSDHNSKINLNLGHYAYPDYEPMAFWGSNDKLMTLISPDTSLEVVKY